MSTVSTIHGKIRLRCMIGLAFLVSTFSSGAIACNYWDTMPCDTSDPHYLPSICDQYPDTPQCVGGWGDDGGSASTPGTYTVASMLDTVNWTWAQVPQSPSNNIQAGCSSSFEDRRASALADVSTWWPTYIYPADLTNLGGADLQLHFVNLTVRYSNGHREAWIVFFPSPNNWGSESIFTGYNNRFGAAYLRLSTQDDFGFYVTDPSASGPMYCG